MKTISLLMKIQEQTQLYSYASNIISEGDSLTDNHHYEPYW